MKSTNKTSVHRASDVASTEYESGFIMGSDDYLRGWADGSKELREMGRNFLSGYEDGFYKSYKSEL